MDQLPGFTQWPVFREILFVFSEVLNFIFNQLNNIGIVNITLAVIFASLFYQILLLPFTIRRSVKSSSKSKVRAELKRLEREYQNKLDNPVLLTEYKKKQEEIQRGKKKKKKGVGCLVFMVQFGIMLCMLNVLAYMNHYVRILSVMDESALSAACSLFGLDIRIATKNDWWPSILLVLLYIAVFFLPGLIMKRIVEVKERKEWLAELSEEERALVKEENKKRDSFSIAMTAIKLISPAMVLFISMNVPVYFVIYWTANIIWQNALLYVANFLYKKIWVPLKKKCAIRKETTKEGGAIS